MIDKMRETLDEVELEIISPILEVEKSRIWSEQSRLEERNDFVLCTILGQGESRCPFQVGFGRKEHRGKMTFSIGLGAEVFDIEEFGDPKEAEELKEDVRRFLKSAVRCEMHTAKGKVRKALYYPSLWILEGQEISFAYVADYVWPFVKTKKEIKYYEPWI